MHSFAIKNVAMMCRSKDGHGEKPRRHSSGVKDSLSKDEDVIRVIGDSNELESDNGKISIATKRRPNRRQLEREHYYLVFTATM